MKIHVLQMGTKNAMLLMVMLLLTASCCNKSVRRSKTQKSEVAKGNPTLRIAVPQGSGEIFVNYKIYLVENDSLFVIDRIVQPGQHNLDSLFLFDTTARFKLDNELILKLEDLITATDTLGYHHPKGYYLPMGWPRFNIQVSMKEKSLEGSISNCYREHIFKFLDFMNKCYPKGPVIEYDIQELKALELSLSEK